MNGSARSDQRESAVLGRRIFFPVLMVLTAAGCTFASVKPDITSGPPPIRPKTLLVGDLRVADSLWDPYKPHFVRGLTEWLKKNGGFENVVTEAGTPAPANSIVLVGTITDVDKGSAVARVLVGMGAGQAKAKGDFEIRDGSGAVLVKFTARESYLGGLGMGGMGLLDMEDLVTKLGERVAKTTDQWLRGEKLD